MTRDGKMIQVFLRHQTPSMTVRCASSARVPQFEVNSQNMQVRFLLESTHQISSLWICPSNYTLLPRTEHHLLESYWTPWIHTATNTIPELTGKRDHFRIFQIHSWTINTIQMFQAFKSFLPWLILRIAELKTVVMVVVTSASKSLLHNQLTSLHSDIQTVSTNCQFQHHQHSVFSITSLTNGLLKLMHKEVLESFLCCLRAVYIFYMAAKWFAVITY